MKKYFKISLAVATAVVMMLAIFVFASAAETVSPDLRIAYCNLSFENDTHIMYAVKSNDANVKLLVWDAPQTEYALGTQTAMLDPLAEQMDINGEMHTIFKYTGLAAKQMTDDVYVRTCIDNGNGDVAYGAVHKYSILQYAYNKLGKTGVATTNEKLIKMLNSLLDYGASAQEYHGYKTNRLANADFFQVKLTDGSLPDGFKSGLYLAGEKVTVKAPAQNAESKDFTRWVDANGNIMSSSDEYSLTVGNTNANLSLTPQYLDPTEGLEFTLINNDREYAVSSIGTATDTDIIIPATYNDKPVTKITGHAFSDNSSIKYVTIPDSITSIDYIAFYDCRSLTSINIPDSVTSIGNYAFDGCGSLTSITFGESSQLESIGDYAFYGCSSLTSINIPDSVTSIGDDAFKQCYDLIYNKYKNGKYLGNTNNPYVYLADVIDNNISQFEFASGVKFIGDCAFQWCYILTSINIPGSVTSIGSQAFSGCESLTSINIPDSVTSISSLAFSGCSGLTSINIPDSVTNIGNLAFSDCSGLTSITVETGNTVYKSIDNCLIETESKTLIVGCQNSVIPDDGSVTSIGGSAFFGCSSLTHINIPNKVTSIGDNAFQGCRGLTSITVETGNTVYKSIDNCLIETESKTLIVGCQNSVIPNDGSVTSIDMYAFYGCSGLTSINIPDSVTSIGISAFYGSSNLTSITFGESSQLESIGNGAFYDTGLTSINIPDGVTSIGTSAFYGCSNLTSITFGESSQLESIGNNAFDDCRGLTSINIPDSVTSIGSYAFRGCRGLTSITVASGNTVYHSAGNCLIETESKTLIVGCQNSVIPDNGSVTSIGNYAFYNCRGLTSINIPDSVTSIGDYAFYFCSGLTSINIPDSVTNIGTSAFSGCSSLTSITVETGNTFYKIIDNCLIETESKTLIVGCQNSVIPDDGSVTSIGDYAFYDCSGLTSINIPDSVTSIGDYAFRGCDGLTSITFTGTMAQWEAIEKGFIWNYTTGEYVIHCTDGDIAKS